MFLLISVISFSFHQIVSAIAWRFVSFFDFVSAQ